jgi:Zn-dependent oligopeptidase
MMIRIGKNNEGMALNLPRKNADSSSSGYGGIDSGNSGFNLAESQATSEDLEAQAQKLISKLKRTQNLKPDKKWKVTLSIPKSSNSSFYVNTYLHDDYTMARKSLFNARQEKAENGTN